MANRVGTGRQPQGVYWIGTIPASSGWAVPEELVLPLCFMRGQREIGLGGLDHWQLIVQLATKQSLAQIRKLFPGHWELSRSKAAEEYVWKEDTRF